MEISKKQTGEVLEVEVKGRLDSYWADHLTSALDASIQEGSHQITLDLSQVDYLSSAGIRVLVRVYKQLKGIDGALRVARPSPAVKKILTMSGLTALLAPETKTEPAAVAPEFDTQERDGVRYQVYDLAPSASLSCRILGDPVKLDGCRFTAEDGHAVALPQSSVALGLGAFGQQFGECRNRFGEFLAVAGTAAYLPTDGTETPDYLVSAGTDLPEMTLLYGLACDGPFGRLARFETSPESGGTGLSALAGHCLAIAGAETAGVVIVAESAGLVGASLRQSPATAEVPRAPFGHPEIRKWITFAPERVFPRAVVVIVGVVSASPPPELRPLVRPLGENGGPSGHFHAAAFSYGPVKRGRIDLRETVSHLFESERLEGVLHLLNDGRAIVGAGESELTRGACWIGPVSSITANGGAQ